MTSTGPHAPGVVLPATCLQQRQVLGSLGAASVANVHFGWRLRGPLDPVALRRTLKALVARHEALRTALRVHGSAVEQHIFPRCALRAEPLDISEPGVRPAQAVRRLLRRHAHEPFDLGAAPLARVALIRMGHADHLLVWTLHHAICDGWSVRLLLEDFRSAYPAAASGQAPELPDPPIQLGDYAVWERELVDDRARAHWRASRSTRPAGLVLAERLAHDPGAGHLQEVQALRPVSPAAVRALTAVARRHRATLATVLTAAFAALVIPHADGPSVALGVTDANRDRAELRDVVGCCIDFLPIHLDISGDPSFVGLLERTREEVRSAYAYRLPIGRLGDRDWWHAPTWFDVLMNFTPIDPVGPTVSELTAGLSVQPAFGPSPQRHAAKYNWSGWRLLGPVLEQDGGGGLTGSLLYNRRLVPSELARRLAERFDRILRAIAVRPDQPLRALLG